MSIRHRLRSLEGRVASRVENLPERTITYQRGLDEHAAGMRYMGVTRVEYPEELFSIEDLAAIRSFAE